MRRDLKGTTEQHEREQTKADPVVQKLRSASRADIDNYIDANVTDLASTKDVLKKLARAVWLLYQ